MQLPALFKNIFKFCAFLPKIIKYFAFFLQNRTHAHFLKIDPEYNTN